MDSWNGRKRVKSLDWLSSEPDWRDAGTMVASGSAKDVGELSPASGPSWAGLSVLWGQKHVLVPGHLENREFAVLEVLEFWCHGQYRCQQCPGIAGWSLTLLLITLAPCKLRDNAGNAPGLQDSSHQRG